MENPMAGQLEQVRAHAALFLEPGEELVAALTASPRGRSTATAAGGVGSMIGYKVAGGQVRNGAEVGLRVEPNMAVALTRSRLLTLKVKISMGGVITDVAEVLSAIPLADVESIDARRFGLGGVLTIAVRGGRPVKLECRAGRARELADAYARM
jgi:hypothetical protein